MNKPTLLICMLLIQGIARAETPAALPSTQPAAFTVTNDAITFDPRTCTEGSGTIWLALGSVKVKVLGQKDGFCVFDYTVEVEGGYTTYRCRIPVSDPPVWVRKGGATGTTTSFDLSKCEKVANGNVHFGPASRPATQPAAVPRLDEVAAVLSMPPCTATVEKIVPCSARLRMEDGKALYIGSPAAGSEVVGFIQTLQEGKTYALPDAFIQYQKNQRKTPN